MAGIITPYCDELVELRAPTEEIPDLKHYAAGLPRMQLSDRSICDLELLSVGAFSPLRTFMGESDFDSVLEGMRLANGILFPLPITLPIEDDMDVAIGEDVALADRKNNLLAVMTLEEIYKPDRNKEAIMAYSTADVRHPLVAELDSWGKRNISGRIRVISLPIHHNFVDLRLTPKETRVALEALGYTNVVAFQTRNPIHRAHEEMTKQAKKQINGSLVIHPSIGMTKPGDIDHYTRVRSYKALIKARYNPGRTLLALLPLAMRMAGPKEALLHAIIRRNYGANHFIVGCDHAGPGNGSNGKPFYGTYEARDVVTKYSDEIGVRPVCFEEFVFLADENRYDERSRAGGGRTLTLSGTQVREEYLYKGRSIPAWFTRPEVARILQMAHPPKHEQGFCVWFTGLSGAGKSTTAEILVEKLLEHGRSATLLDGDIVRSHLSKGLGFSKEDRDANVIRIGFVASEIVRHGGAVVCAAVSPYRSMRNACRAMVGSERFIEVFVNTPLETCEERDVKGMYELARAGNITNFTGVDDPYEPPLDPEVIIDGASVPAAANAQEIIEQIITRLFIHPGTFEVEELSNTPRSP